MSEFHTWGAPVYVLSSECQGSMKPPNWTERAYLCMFLGRYPVHAPSVELVLNIVTGMITPQYHLVFDDDFETVKTEVPTDLLPPWA